MSDFASFKDRLQRVQPSAPRETVPIDAADEIAARHDFVSREPARRVKRMRIDGPIEVLSVKGPLDVLNRFKTFANEEGYTSYWQAIDALLKNVGR